MRILAALLLLGSFPALLRGDDPPKPTVRFDRVVVDDAFPDAYQVEVVDVDGDKKPDIVALGGATIAWYQNPTWTKRVIASGGNPLAADIISSATLDLDGDGKREIAIACDFAMNTPTRGHLFLASQGATLDARWTFRKVADVPSIHRLRWVDINGDRKRELIVAPLFGPKSKPPTYDQDLATVTEFQPDPQHPITGHWTTREIMRRPVVHAIKVLPSKMDKNMWQSGGSVTTADNTGLSNAHPVLDQAEKVVGWEASPESLIRGATGPAPKRGSSEIQFGQLAIQRAFITTIDPWHGSELVVWELSHGWKTLQNMWKGLGTSRNPFEYSRTVIDNTLDDGHALWVADVDGDGTDEIFAGHRGKDHRVAMYQFDGKAWNRTVLDTGVAAQDLRGGDIDSDGVPDVVAVGGKTHNVVWYRPIRGKP